MDGTLLLFGILFAVVVGGIVAISLHEEKAFKAFDSIFMRARSWAGGRKALFRVKGPKAKVIDLDSARWMKKLRDDAGGLKESLGAVPKVVTKKRNITERN